LRNPDLPLLLIQKYALPDFVIPCKLVPCPGYQRNLGEIVHIDKVEDVGCNLVRQLGEEIYPWAIKHEVIVLVEEQEFFIMGGVVWHIGSGRRGLK